MNKLNKTVTSLLITIIFLIILFFSRSFSREVKEIKKIINEAVELNADAQKTSNLEKNDFYRVKFKEIYVDDELTSNLKLLDGIKQYPDFSKTDGGIYKLKYKKIEINQDFAEVLVDEYSWMVTGNYKNNNGIHHDLRLRKVGGRWLISKDNWSFIEGYEP